MSILRSATRGLLSCSSLWVELEVERAVLKGLRGKNVKKIKKEEGFLRVGLRECGDSVC